jgi:hypothetical protein
MNKTAISTAIAAALGLGMTAGVAHATAVTGFTIVDVGSNTANGIGNFSATTDGRSGAFKFSSTYINVATYTGASLWTGDVPSGTIFAGANATGSFSTGFIFSGAPFTPYMYGSGFGADITNGALTVSSMNFGGNYGPGTNFNLPPDAGHPLQVLFINTVGRAAGDYNVAVRWGHDITSAEDPSLNFSAFTAQWVIEGCMTTNAGGKCTTTPPAAVPVPAAAWLFGSGLMGLAAVARRRKKA